MNIFKTVAETQGFALSAKRSGKTIAVVPTMGYLHAGHASLIDIARKNADVVIVSVFVNPTQFGPNEDLASYPRSFEQDAEVCREHGADAVFAPADGEMYCPDRSIWVNEEQLSAVLCGKSRPIHFRGVCTVVAKLFNITLPDVAVFGQKDAQQALIIKRMVRDLNFPVKIIVAPLVRDADGLALSSRNKYLSGDQRRDALVLSRSLFAAEATIREGGREVIPTVLELIKSEIAKAHGRVDYVECLDSDNLQAPTGKTREVLLALAARFGETRLIDNILIKLQEC